MAVTLLSAMGAGALAGLQRRSAHRSHAVLPVAVGQHSTVTDRRLQYVVLLSRQIELTTSGHLSGDSISAQ
jgi:hypothetical protein